MPITCGLAVALCRNGRRGSIPPAGRAAEHAMPETHSEDRSLNTSSVETGEAAASLGRHDDGESDRMSARLPLVLPILACMAGAGCSYSYQPLGNAPGSLTLAAPPGSMQGAVGPAPPSSSGPPVSGPYRGEAVALNDPGGVCGTHLQVTNWIVRGDQVSFGAFDGDDPPGWDPAHAGGAALRAGPVHRVAFPRQVHAAAALLRLRNRGRPNRLIGRCKPGASIAWSGARAGRRPAIAA